METRTETDLVIAEDAVMVKERVAVRLDQYTKSVGLSYPITIISIKARSKSTILRTKKLSENSIEVYSENVLSPGDVFSFELSMLVEPEMISIANLKVLHWGSLDLYRVICLVKPYQVLGFGKLRIENTQWEYSDNLTSNLKAHISRFRNSRIELGEMLKFRLKLTYTIDCSSGGRVVQFSSFGPISNNRQSALLKSKGVKIERDEDHNEIYVWEKQVDSGQKVTRSLEWIVSVRAPPHISTDLGTMKALKMAVRQSKSLQRFVKGSPDHWNVWDDQIQEIAGHCSKYHQIFQVHQFLFEFTNRRLQYDANGVRMSPIEALHNRIGDCSEFSDLLVTLHRAANIPSRIKEGIIIDTSPDKRTEGHAWVEFLTTQGWVPSDPTWGLLLGVSAQHIEFNTHTSFKETSVYEMQYQGQEPVISWTMDWEDT